MSYIMPLTCAIGHMMPLKCPYITMSHIMRPLKYSIGHIVPLSVHYNEPRHATKILYRPYRATKSPYITTKMYIGYIVPLRYPYITMSHIMPLKCPYITMSHVMPLKCSI